MNNKPCSQCDKEPAKSVLYQCCRCFTKYNQETEGSNGGRRCPQCGMGARLVIPVD